jgi:outer membrane protein assembly factor BamB
VIGHPLLIGEELLAVSQDDIFLRWRPLGQGQFITLAHPAPGTTAPDLAPVNMLGGYPIARSSTGILIADDQVSPFISSFASLTEPNWHRDILNRLGVPAVQKDVMFTNVGGGSALSALVAINTSTGSTIWEHAPGGFPSEPTTIVDRVTRRRATPAEQRALGYLKQQKAKGASAHVSDNQEVSVLQSTVAIDALHGHWLNPGLVTTRERVYGQVQGTIVALAQRTGDVAWRFDLEPTETARSIAATADHLFVSLNRRLVALRLDDGKLEWSVETPRAGTLTIANGLVLLAMGQVGTTPEGGELIAFASDAKDKKVADKEKVAPIVIPPPR